MTAAALSRLQTHAASYLSDTAQVWRNTKTDDGQGGQADSWAQTGPSVGCLLEPWAGRKGGEEDVILDKFEQNLPWKVSLPSGTDVTAADEIRVGARVFEVNAVLAPATLQALSECICTERLSG